eukprot:CAMPEP_0197253028 /NCGR_PEP_ID=MMETSP1429-20130617/63417_1 /TAXON_ID=49237 /ORGANISM="Chaetoceros  sp., Strain UNC1202" /LENGTH=35 /DNA_ID= /DNA_START= /DNA_END= /DNA_ORIENTATION=
MVLHVEVPKHLVRLPPADEANEVCINLSVEESIGP